MTKGMKNLLNYIHSLTEFNQTNWNNLLPALTQLEFKKDEYLLQAGAVCNELFFISKGLCRAFQKKEVQEVNTAFFLENDIATNIYSFATGEVSELAIQACEAVSVVRFDKKLLRQVSLTDPQIEKLGRLCLQQIAIRQEKHAAIYKLMSPQERYTYLQTEYPDFLQRVTLTQLSSYIGVARETLSRIRRRRA